MVATAEEVARRARRRWWRLGAEGASAVAGRRAALACAMCVCSAGPVGLNNAQVGPTQHEVLTGRAWAGSPARGPARHNPIYFTSLNELCLVGPPIRPPLDTTDKFTFVAIIEQDDSTDTWFDMGTLIFAMIITCHNWYSSLLLSLFCCLQHH